MQLSRQQRRALEWVRDKPNRTGFDGYVIFALADKGLVTMSGSSDDVKIELTDAGREALRVDRK